MPSQVSNKVGERRHAVATDRNGSEIRKDDTVKEIGGEGQQGQVICIFRSFLFLHNREVPENGGNFVVRSSNVATIAAKGGRVIGNGAIATDLTKMNPNLQRNGGSMAAPPVPKSVGRDKLIGKTVIIRRGPLKGLLGIVKDSTDTHARVELHTKRAVVTVAKENLGIKEYVRPIHLLSSTLTDDFISPLTGQSIDLMTFSGGRGRGGAGRGSYGGATPQRNDWAGSRTPMAAGNDGRTPAWGMPSRTPAWAGGAQGGRTPAWKQDGAGGRTPAYAADGARTVNPYAEGSRTSYGGGGKTPAWNPGAQTPFGGSSYGHSDSSDAFNPGSKTPAYGQTGSNDAWAAGSKTPAYGDTGSSSNAADAWNTSSHSSRPYDAPTPGLDLNAPTPGAAFSAPTPGGYSAPTPAANSAPTPKPSWGGHADVAPTPAASGMGMSAPTPGASYGGGGPPRGAPTPGAGFGNPETPGGWGGADAEGEDDDEPRYED